jgi:glycerol uptake facilitator-like aquaporin
VFEAVGAFFLSIGAMSCSYSPLNDICIPNIVFWVNVLSGRFTGAHLNAMITMSWVFKSRKQFRLPLQFVVVYILSQIMGTFLGGFVLYFLHGTSCTTKPHRLDTLSDNQIY